MTMFKKWVLAALCAAGGGACSAPGTNESTPPLTERKASVETGGAAGPAVLLKDLGERKRGGVAYVPASIVAAGSTLFFSAYTDTTWQEMWRSDGTTQGTWLLHEFVPGYETGYFGEYFHLRGLTYFMGNDLVHGREMWRTDGTPEGTFLLADICPGPDDSSASGFAESRGQLIFRVRRCGGSSYQLWRSDGTPEGTVRADPSREWTEGYIQAFTTLGEAVYFIGPEPRQPHHPRLWRMDASETSAEMIDTSPRITRDGQGTPLVRWGDSLFFASGGELWKSDGSPAGTVRVKTIPTRPTNMAIDLLTPARDGVYFAANDGVSGLALWRSDGTEAGTVLVADLDPYDQGSDPSSTYIFESLIPVGDKLFFTYGRPYSSTRTLYVTDGTARGTVNLREFSGTSASTIKDPRALNNRLYFIAYDNTLGYELWSSDGTMGGTRALGDFFPKNDPWVGPNPHSLTVMDDSLYFAGPYEGQNVLWKSRGLAGETAPLGAELKPTLSSDATRFTQLGDDLYFVTYEERIQNQLWRGDGTAAGTLPIFQMATRDYFFDDPGPTQLTVMNDAVYFGYFNHQRSGLAMARGDQVTGLGSAQLDFEAGFPVPLVAHQGTLYFAGRTDAEGTELWKTDGTSEGTQMVKDLYPVSNYSSRPRGFTPLGDAVYFTASTTEGSGLWRTNGTEAGTWRVKSLALGCVNSSSSRQPAVSFTEHGGLLYFAATNGSGCELWRTDGTETGTTLVKDLTPGADYSEPRFLTSFGGFLYFVATEATSGRELWRTDGTEAGTTLVTDLAPGSASSSPTSLAVLGGWLYFIADDGLSGRELWRTDGTPEGTTRITDANPGKGHGLSAQVLFPLPDEGLLLFTADDGSHGMELWKSDGTPAGTGLLQEIAPGALGSTPSNFARYKDSVVFTAEDGVHGREPWLLERAKLTNTTPPTISCPLLPVTAEALQHRGAPVRFAATATDDTTASPAITYSTPPGGFFPLGETRVTATARDDAGLTATCTFTVLVRDTTPPQVVCPSSATVEAMSEKGALLSFPSPRVSDAVTATPLVTLSHASGGTFPQGSTSVKVTATDEAGNHNACSFTVTVRDTTASVVACPADQFAEATRPEGAYVTYPEATATDAASHPQVTHDWPSGGLFPPGTTRVTATATDGANNLSSCTFSVTVRDTTAPSLTCPGPLQAEATGPEGARLDFSPPTAADVVSRVETHSSHSSGDVFPLGETLVQAQARDAAGNETRCAFTVQVRDTTAPRLTCPENIHLSTRTREPVAVELPGPQATDLVTEALVLESSTPSGSLFPPGVTPVELSARDAAGNVARCTYTVTVQPGSHGGCGATPGAGTTGGMGLASLVLLALARRRGPRSA
ncbi:ELWxxDGT repeat protein [Cystobacter fuscus]|uniref:ELWxxDGT repeat protein n=1 Tax=Cystobacter fuscus TaxID=43 RepID=UPI002B2CE24C|nr:HYR domain-containing protein [Cystobacter fuscus]